MPSEHAISNQEEENNKGGQKHEKGNDCRIRAIRAVRGIRGEGPGIRKLSVVPTSRTLGRPGDFRSPAVQDHSIELLAGLGGPVRPLQCHHAEPRSHCVVVLCTEQTSKVLQIQQVAAVTREIARTGADGGIPPRGATNPVFTGLSRSCQALLWTLTAVPAQKQVWHRICTDQKSAQPNPRTRPR